jgi:hypothetical protein
MPTLNLDRSRIVARQECAMLRYINYHWGGKGIIPKGGNIHLRNGIAIHRGIETIWKTDNINAACQVAALEFWKDFTLTGTPLNSEETKEKVRVLKEQWALVEGLLRGWHKVRYPLLREDYEVVAIEEEFEVELAPGIRLMLRFDVVLRRKADGLLVVLDYKTLSYLSDDWQKQHEVSLQTLLYTWAASKHFGESSVGIQYEGLTKGLRRMETAKSSPFEGKKVQLSPLVYGYHMPGAGLWQSEWPKGAKGWTKVYIPDHHKSEEWVDLLEQEGKLSDLFPVIPVVMPTYADQEAAVASVVYEEEQFARRLTVLEDSQKFGQSRGEAERRLFEQNRGRCYKYGIGNACPMLDYCYNATTRQDPLDNGFEARTPHHDGEVENG